MSLADRVDAVHAEFRRLSALALGGEVVEDGGMLFWAGPNAAPMVANGAIRRDASVSADDALRASGGTNHGPTRHANPQDPP